MMDPRSSHPASEVARYIALLASNSAEEPSFEGKFRPGACQLTQQLLGLHALNNGKASGNLQNTRQHNTKRHIGKVLAFAQQCSAAEIQWAVLQTVADEVDLRLAAAYEKLSHGPLAYFARYEQARALFKANHTVAAATIFRKLYRDAVASGVAPPVDSDFRQCLQQAEGGDDLRRLVLESAETLLKAKRRVRVVALAWQCHELGDGDLAEEVLSLALAGANEEELPVVSLAAAALLRQTGQIARAANLLDQALKDQEFQQDPALWQAAANLADRRNLLAQAIAYHERALDLKYERLSGQVNLETLRADYGALLSGYQRLASAVATLQVKPSEDLLARVVRAADRWRSLDDDVTAACEAATGVFSTLGAEDLAWDYLTTPLALKPNEAAGWLSIARQRRVAGDWRLADRAYTAAFESERTNAQILWDHAQLLQQYGGHAKAQELYRQIANGPWQPRFQWLQRQAKRIVGME